MHIMNNFSLVAYGAPLQQRDVSGAACRGTEVLLRVTHCGVCHSDLHLQDGYFDLGGGKQLDISNTHTLPLTLGHEVCGEVLELGPDAGETEVRIGDQRVVYPWIGCGQCQICVAGDEHLCGKPQALGINVDGGYGQYMRVPHPRYLISYRGVADAVAGTYMCSGLTAYSALARLGDTRPPDSLAIVGLGGVGMMGLAFARTLYPDAALLGVDIDKDKLVAASDRGIAVYDSSDRSAIKQLLQDTGGGVAGAVDFVGSEASLGFAHRTVRKGGRVVIVGLFGGGFSMPIPMFPFRAISLIGSYVGSLRQAEEMMELARSGQVEPIPVEERALEKVNQALADLRSGKVLGRLVLDCRH